MNINMGQADRIIRVLIGVVALWLAFASGLPMMESMLWRGIAAVIGVVMLSTAVMRRCPLYRVLGLKTCRSS